MKVLDYMSNKIKIEKLELAFVLMVDNSLEATILFKVYYANQPKLLDFYGEIRDCSKKNT